MEVVINKNELNLLNDAIKLYNSNIKFTIKENSIKASKTVFMEILKLIDKVISKYPYELTVGKIILLCDLSERINYKWKCSNG